MKNQYCGDINDFFKYALLRSLLARDFRGTICWMLTPDDQSGDGRRLGYLQQPSRFRTADPVTFDFLSELCRSGRRDVRAVRAGGLLPHARFFEHTLEDAREQRAGYFDELWRVAEGSDFVFFDPDNGLEIRSITRGNRGSAKYLYLADVENALARGHTSVIYQHFPRVDHLSYVESTQRRIREHTGIQPLTLWTSSVLFVVVPLQHHVVALTQRLEYASQTWSDHFTLGWSS